MKYEFKPGEVRNTLKENLKRERERLTKDSPGVELLLTEIKRKCSIEQIAEYLGHDRMTYGRYEDQACDTTAPLEDLLKLCNLYDCDLDYLLGFQETKRKRRESLHALTGLSEEAIEVLIENKEYPWVLDHLLKWEHASDLEFKILMEGISTKWNDENLGLPKNVYRKLREEYQRAMFFHGDDMLSFKEHLCGALGIDYEFVKTALGLTDDGRYHFTIEEDGTQETLTDIGEISDLMHYMSEEEGKGQRHFKTSLDDLPAGLLDNVEDPLGQILKVVDYECDFDTDHFRSGRRNDIKEIVGLFVDDFCQAMKEQRGDDNAKKQR